MAVKFYRCRYCGNVIEKVVDSKVPVVCCGEKMEELVANTVEASVEKHLPVVTVDGDKVTVLQAISLARDLTIFGMRENVTVIRERDGERTMYEINLCDVSMFNSPAYYLQQNDVVYVQPSQIKARQSTTDDKALRLTSIFVSGGSLLVSIAALIVNLVR